MGVFEKIKEIGCRRLGHLVERKVTQPRDLFCDMPDKRWFIWLAAIGYRGKIRRVRFDKNAVKRCLLGYFLDCDGVFEGDDT